MGLQHNYLKRAGFILLTAAAVFSVTLAFAAESGDKKVSAAIPAKPAETKVTSPAKAETPGEKKSEKTEVKETPKDRKPVRHKSLRKAGVDAPLPGAHLTVRQVMETLKTTRDFSGKNLSGLYLVGLDLSRCNFRGTDLSWANLARADLNEAALERTDLSGANMKMTDLRLTGMKGARLEGARLDGAIWQDGTICAKGSTGSCREE